MNGNTTVTIYGLRQPAATLVSRREGQPTYVHARFVNGDITFTILMTPDEIAPTVLALRETARDLEALLSSVREAVPA